MSICVYGSASFPNPTPYPSTSNLPLLTSRLPLPHNVQVLEALDVAAPVNPVDPDQAEVVAAAGTGSGVTEAVSATGKRACACACACACLSLYICVCLSRAHSH